MDGTVLNCIHSVVELDTKEFKNYSMFMTLLSDELTNVSHNSITNYIGQNEFRTPLMFAIKEGTPETNDKQTVIDLKNFANNELPNQIIEKVL